MLPAESASGSEKVTVITIVSRLLAGRLLLTVPFFNSKKQFMKKISLLLLSVIIPCWLIAQDDEKGPVASYYNPFTALDNFNGGGVNNNPSSPTSFTVNFSCLITTIQTYHWNYGRGAAPGTIKLVHANGTVYGPWNATGLPGSGGVPNAFWQTSPNVVIPAGTYTVIDSGNTTWSCNGQSQNKGFTRVLGKRK